MNQTIAIVLILLVAGVPILLILGFVVRQVRKMTENREKIPLSLRIAEGVLTLGFALLVGVPIVAVDDLWAAHLMTQPLRTVSGTIEDVREVVDRDEAGITQVLSPVFGYTLTVEKKKYLLDAHAGDENFSAREWAQSAQGQQVTLSVSSESVLSRVLDVFDRKVWHSGEVYGVTLEDGTVVLDAEAEKNSRDEQREYDWALYPKLLAAGGVLTAAGYAIKRKRKE